MRLVAALMLLTLTAAARGEPFWCEYDASCAQFPEQVGWGRLVMGQGELRSLADGLLTINSLASPSIIDSYGLSRPVDLGPGELFVLEWRLRVDEVHGLADRPIKANVHVAFDGHGMGNFAYSESSLYCWFEHTWIDFEPYVFHEYALTTSDLLTYTLKIDGRIAHAGALATPCYRSTTDWGDEVTGATSVSDWDYIRFGVIPEPSGALLVVSACLAGIVLRAR